jgi:putative ABC transport system substrate-binding protein
MRRRDFITGLGATALPSAARAQQPMPVVGFLRSTTAADTASLAAAFRQGLKEMGFVEGQNVAIVYHYADNQLDRLPALTADLIRRPVAVIAVNHLSAVAVRKATATIPIIFATGGDPVRDGLVANLNRPGGNVTGVSFLAGELGAKRLQLLHELVPKAAVTAMLINPNTPETEAERRDVEAAARATGQNVLYFDAASGRDIETAFARLIGVRVGALLVGVGGFMNSHREQIVALAARHALPASYGVREAVVAGGLMSYAPSITDAYREVGIYAGRVLKGEKPGDLPVVQSAKFEFVINLKTAKALGLEFHPQLLATADEVIE